METPFRQQLIDSVHEEGRPLYKQSLDAIDTAVGRQGNIAAIHIRVIKGIRQLSLPAARITQEGLATEDGEIVDCSAAVVQRKKDHWERYSGKDSPHITRIHSSYDPEAKEFSLWSTGDQGETAMHPQRFSTELLKPRPWDEVAAKFSSEMLPIAFAHPDLTNHVRKCLEPFEPNAHDLEVIVRPEGFQRFSDTRDPGIEGVQTLYTDGAQIHAGNRKSNKWQNEHIPHRYMQMANYRAGLEIDGEEMYPHIEDLIYEIRLRTQDSRDIAMYFESLTPRCPVPQRKLRTGEIEAEPKVWHRKHRPLRPWDNKWTWGSNVDTDPAADGEIIHAGKDGSTFQVISEKKRWRSYGEY